MDYHALPRRQLQALCKKHGVPTNATNLEMADALSALLKPKPDTRKRSGKCAPEPGELSSRMEGTKARNLETEEENPLERKGLLSEKTRRTTRNTGSVIEAPTVVISKVEPGHHKKTSAAGKQGTKSVSTRSRLGVQGETGVESKPSEVVKEKAESPDSEEKKERGGGIVIRRARVKVRSPRTRSKNSEFDRSLQKLEENVPCHNPGQAGTKAHTQSCLVETQKVQNRKSKRFVTFSEVLEVTHSFPKSPTTGSKPEDACISAGLLADETEQSLVCTSDSRKDDDSKVETRHASRKHCVQTTVVPVSSLEKTKEMTGAKGEKVLIASKQSHRHFSLSPVDNLESSGMGKTILKENCFRSRQRSTASDRMGNDASFPNEKERNADNVRKDDLRVEAPLVPITRRSRRLTLIASDITSRHERDNVSMVNNEEKIVKSSQMNTLVPCSREKMPLNERCGQSGSKQRTNDGENGSEKENLVLREIKELLDHLSKHVSQQEAPSALITRQSRRLTLGAPDYAISQEKGKCSGKQEKEKIAAYDAKDNPSSYGVSSGRRSKGLPGAPSEIVVNRAKNSECNHIEPGFHTNEDSSCTSQNACVSPVVPNSIGARMKSKVSGRVKRVISKHNGEKKAHETRSGVHSKNSKPRHTEETSKI